MKMKDVTDIDPIQFGGSNVKVMDYQVLLDRTLFKNLGSDLYQNQIRAIIRELSCNAADAHLAAGNATKAYDVHLPTAIEPFFKIRDYGTGLCHEDMCQIYQTYGRSTKRDCDLQTGALGLGSKSPLGYAQNFTASSYFNGELRHYQVFLNDKGLPSLAYSDESTPTDKPNGLEINVPVSGDFERWEREARYIYFFLCQVPVNIGDEVISETVDQIKEIVPGVISFNDEPGHHKHGVAAAFGLDLLGFENKPKVLNIKNHMPQPSRNHCGGWMRESLHSSRKIGFLQSGVFYPIMPDDCEQLIHTVFQERSHKSKSGVKRKHGVAFDIVLQMLSQSENDLIIKVENGEIEFPPNRESATYNEHSIKLAQKAFEQMIETTFENFDTKLNELGVGDLDQIDPAAVLAMTEEQLQFMTLLSRMHVFHPHHRRSSARQRADGLRLGAVTKDRHRRSDTFQVHIHSEKENHNKASFDFKPGSTIFVNVTDFDKLYPGRWNSKGRVLERLRSDFFAAYPDIGYIHERMYNGNQDSVKSLRDFISKYAVDLQENEAYKEWVSKKLEEYDAQYGLRPRRAERLTREELSWPSAHVSSKEHTVAELKEYAKNGIIIYTSETVNDLSYDKMALVMAGLRRLHSEDTAIVLLRVASPRVAKFLKTMEEEKINVIELKDALKDSATQRQYPEINKVFAIMRGGPVPAMSRGLMADNAIIDFRKSSVISEMLVELDIEIQTDEVDLEELKKECEAVVTKSPKLCTFLAAVSTNFIHEYKHYLQQRKGSKELIQNMVSELKSGFDISLLIK